MQAPKVAGDYLDLFKNINEMRDSANTAEEMKRIEQFKTSADVTAPADTYLSPNSYQTLQKLRAEKLDSLQRGEAGIPLGQIRDLQLDPRFQDAASLEEINKNPTQAVFGQNPPQVSGVMPGAAKGSVVAAPGYNPHISNGIADFQTGNQNTLDVFRASNGDRMAGARVAQNKDLAAAFDNSAQGMERFAKTDATAADKAAENELNQFIADNEMPQNVQGWNVFWDKARKIKNVSPTMINTLQTSIAARNNGPVGKPLTQFVQNGPNSTRAEVNVDMFGEPIAATRTTSTNNPSDREQGLIPDRTAGPGKQKAPALYSITKADGTTRQIDANTAEGRERLNAALNSGDGDRVSRLGTVSESNTSVGPDGSTTTRRVTGATGKPGKAAQAETGISKSGKPMVKVNGVWEYK
jgi:hypothetical protein